MPGKFITLDGFEGGGKTTMHPFVTEVLAEAGIGTLTTREPGGTALGERLRALLLDDGAITIGDDAELLMIFAARAQHLEEVVRPALAMGKWVVCDRFTDATYAYQGGGREIACERIATLERWVQGGLQPDLTLLLDVSIELGLQRAKRRAALDRFEAEDLAFFQRVYQSYRRRAEQDPRRFRCIDAGQPIDQVRAGVRRYLREFIAQSSAPT